MTYFFPLQSIKKCYRTTNLGLKEGEEPDCTEAAESLFLDEDGRLLPSNEAMFANQVVWDGDTRGSASFVTKQKEIIGTAAKNKGKQALDVADCIKNVSNSLHKLLRIKKKHSGVQLLDSSRIRSDLSSYLSDHSREKILLLKLRQNN